MQARVSRIEELEQKANDQDQEVNRLSAEVEALLEEVGFGQMRLSAVLDRLSELSAVKVRVFSCWHASVCVWCRFLRVYVYVYVYGVSLS